MSFWSESDFIPGIHLLFLFLLLCSCAPVTPFHSKHVFTHIYWLLFWLSSALHSPACRAWSACARSSPFSLLLKQMLCSVLRLVSLFKHHWASDSGLHGSTKEHLCIFFFQDEPECMKYFYREKVPGWGSSTPGAVRLCQRFVNRWGWSIFTLISNSTFSHTLFMPCNHNKKAKYLHQVPFCNSLWHQASHRRLLCLLFPAQQWRGERE